MASQYQHRQFFRRVPNALLAQYFERKEIDLGVDFGELSETHVEPIFEAFTTLAEGEQAAMEADFLDINALACDGGIAALLNEAAFYQDETFAGATEAVDGYHGKVMWAFLNRPEYWRGAASLLHADNVSFKFWKKRNDLPPVPPNVEREDIERLEQGISGYFNKTEGRGRNCKVEPYRKVKTGKVYFFAYPEDYGQSGVEWDRSRLTTRSRHPAFEIIFVYCQAEGSLDIYAPNNPKAVPELQRIFANTILRLDSLPDGRIDNRVYDLDPLADPSFETGKKEAGDRSHVRGLSGWYVVHLDRVPAGALGSWKAGESQTWCAKSKGEQTPVERADIRALMAKVRRQHKTERDQQQRAAASRALGIWNRCRPAPVDYPYLVNKRVTAHGARLARRGNLVIPASDGERLTTLRPEARHSVQADGAGP